MTTFKKFSAISASILMLTAVTLTSLSVTSAFAAESPTQSVDEANAYTSENTIPKGQPPMPEMSPELGLQSSEGNSSKTDNTGFQQPELYWTTTTITGVRSGQSTTLKFFNDNGQLNWSDEQKYINAYGNNMATSINGGS